MKRFIKSIEKNEKTFSRYSSLDFPQDPCYCRFPYCYQVTDHRKGLGKWLSLVEHSVRDAGVGGSNPLFPTII